MQAHGGPCVLLAEDDANDELLFRSVIKRSGRIVRLLAVKDGVELVEYLTNCKEVPKLLFLDVNMPRMSGIQALRHIRELPHMRTVPIVMLSTSDESRDVSDSVLGGANSYLQKPMNFDDFSRQIEVAIDYWLGLNLQPQSGA